MSRWRRILKEGLLERGLIAEVKEGLQHLEQEHGVVSKTTATAKQWWLDSELGPPPDRRAEPLEALRYELNLVVSSLLQRPHQESYYLVRSLGQALGQQLLSHPVFRGLGPLLNVLGKGNGPRQLTGLLGTNWMGQTLLRGGSGLVAGQQAHNDALAIARDYDNLSPDEQSLIDQAMLLLALIQENPTSPVIADGIERLQQQLDSQGPSVAESLTEPHKAHFLALIKRRLPRWPPEPED